MGEPVTFRVQENFKCHYVHENESDRQVGFYTFAGVDMAKSHVAYLNREHANGRVAQAHCKHGRACDFDRVNDPTRALGAIERASLILCDEHAKVIK